MNPEPFSIGNAGAGELHLRPAVQQVGAQPGARHHDLGTTAARHCQVSVQAYLGTLRKPWKLEGTICNHNRGHPRLEHSASQWLSDHE